MIALLLALAPSAEAGPCDVYVDGMRAGPVGVGFHDGDLGVARRICPRTEVGFAAGGLAVVETENFYGHIVAGGTLEGSWALSPRTELFATLESFRYDSVITPIPATFMGFGHTSVGAMHRVWEDEQWGVGVHGRAVLPTAVGLYRNAFPVGLDVGVGAQWTPARSFRVHGDLTALGSAAISRGPALPWGGARVTVGAEWQAWRPFSVAADVLAGFGYADAVDHVAFAPAFRFAAGRRVGIELAAALPVAGRERALASGELRIDVRLGKLPEGPGARAVDTSDTWTDTCGLGDTYTSDTTTDTSADTSPDTSPDTSDTSAVSPTPDTPTGD